MELRPYYCVACRNQVETFFAKLTAAGDKWLTQCVACNAEDPTFPDGQNPTHLVSNDDNLILKHKLKDGLITESFDDYVERKKKRREYERERYPALDSIVVRSVGDDPLTPEERGEITAEYRRAP